MTKYKAVLFAPDGDWVTDHRGETIDEVWDKIADQGSRWIFYPFSAIIVDHGGFTTGTQRIVDTCPPFMGIKHRSINTVSRLIASVPEEDMRMILDA